MTDPPHTFMVYRMLESNDTWILAKFRLARLSLMLTQASEIIVRLDDSTAYKRMMEFVSYKREPGEPAAFDILRDLFPTHREALDRCEILMQPIVEVAEADGQAKA